MLNFVRFHGKKNFLEVIKNGTQMTLSNEKLDFQMFCRIKVMI